MVFHLNRTDYGPDGIFGTLTGENVDFNSVTLEHAYPKVDGHFTSYIPKIPAGTYTCIKYMSPKNHKEVWLLKDVPNAKMIEIHIGNFNADSDGCILLGRRVAQRVEEPDDKMITSSGNTFYRFMDLTRNAETISLVIKDS